MLKEKIKTYISDPGNAQYNYDLGKEYEILKQYSAACGHFLRAADRTDDTELIYNSLVSAAKSLIEHGDSFAMAEKILKNAINVNSSRIDAFYMLLLIYKYIGKEDDFINMHPFFLKAKEENTKSEIYDMINLNDVMKKYIPSVGTIRHSEDQPQKDFKHMIEKEFAAMATTPSDIHEHLPVLYELAKECNHIIEMGVRTGVSTRAFLRVDARLISYDIVTDQKVVDLINEAKKAGKDATFIEADVLKIDIEETDLLFIDTWHTYEQLKQELALHGNKSRKYMVFHDTNTFGLKNEGGEAYGTSQGLLPAIIEFLMVNPHWRFKKFLTNNNGLTVLERL
jgi:tetratricopeptide (TPR) repeat protein